MLQDTNDSVYQPGQEWSYKSRPGEEEATFTVCKVEKHPKYGTIIHVGLEGLNVKNPMQKSGFSDSISHLAFSEEAIDKSVFKILKKNAPLPEDLQEDFNLAYKDWRDDFDAGKAAVFSIPIAEAIDYIERAINESGDN
jgi:hypothetical protein